jgi:hypothetical protein
MMTNVSCWSHHDAVRSSVEALCYGDYSAADIATVTLPAYEAQLHSITGILRTVWLAHAYTQ